MHPVKIKDPRSYSRIIMHPQMHPKTKDPQMHPQIPQTHPEKVRQSPKLSQHTQKQTHE